MPAAMPGRELNVRERLLDAALQVLATDGIHALTQTRVAEQAGLRQSHLTYYFPTRCDLLKQIVEHAAAAVPGMARGDAATQSPTRASLKALLAERVADGRIARVLLALMAATDEDPSLKSWMAEFNTRMHHMLGEVLASMGHRVKPQEVVLFYATAVGITVLYSSEGTEASAREARKQAGLAFDRLIASARAT